MPNIKLHLFGSFYVTREGQLWDDFRSDKTRALLAYLVLEGAHSVRRAHLAELLWDGYPQQLARASLRMALVSLRQLLGPFDLLYTTNQVVQIHVTHQDFWCDALALEALFMASPDRITTETRPTVVQLYQGEFLQNFEVIDSQPFQKWLETQRKFYAQLVAPVRNMAPKGNISPKL